MKGRNRIISETTKKVLNEYLGVSDEIMGISEEIFNTLISQMGNEPWHLSDTFVNPDGSDGYVKWMFLNIEGTKASRIIKNVYVKLYGFDDRKYTSKEYETFLLKKGLLKISYSPSYKAIKLIMGFPLSGRLDSYSKNNLMTSLNHEVKHAFQDNKKGGIEISNAYLNSLRTTDFDADEPTTIKLMRYNIKDCYYVLDVSEIDARLQEIYIELYQNGGQLNECESYKRVLDAINNYKWLFNILKPKDDFDDRYYQKEREAFQQTLDDELGGGITINMFMRYCERGIKRFNERFRRIITRYREENGLESGGSFRNYAHGEIPQGNIFNGKRSNPSVWQKMRNFFKRR